MTGSPSLWRVAVDVPASAVEAYVSALEPLCQSVSWFGEGNGPWRVEGWSEAEPDRGVVDVALAIAAVVAAAEPMATIVEPVAGRDWAAEVLERFPPLPVGRFIVHGSHVPVEGGRGFIPLLVDAATAFGSGHHGSTAGCLEAISALAHRPVRRALDMGCGSGILAAAIAKLWRAHVIAADIDPRAVAVATETVRRNGVGRWVRIVCSDGYRNPQVASGVPYDLITANILARPLRRMARELVTRLAPGGVAVLAGFLAADANAVLAAHRWLGLRLVRRIDLAGWTTLIVERPHPHPRLAAGTPGPASLSSVEESGSSALANPVAISIPTPHIAMRSQERR